MAQKGRRYLRVENRPRQHAHFAQKNLQILRARMEQLHDAFVFQHRLQCAQIADGERVHDNSFVVGGQLNKAQLRVVGFLAKKLRIDRQNARTHGALDERHEVFLVCYVHRGFLTLCFTLYVVPCHHSN